MREGGRDGGGGGGGPDTELKTKTPHVNVGKNGDDWGMVYHYFHHINQEVMVLGVSEKWAVYLISVMNFSGNFPWRKWSVQRAAPS